MDLQLEGRTVLVTGATGGIGGAVARAFSREGARVALTYHRDEKAALLLAAELGSAEDRACAVPYALEDRGTVDAAVLEVERRWGGLDVLVANAVRWGVRRDPATRFEDVPVEDWMPVIDENLVPTIRTVQAAVGSMRRNGWGRIVLISSVVTKGQRVQEFYGAAKAGLHAFAASVAWDTGPDGILVNVVRPGLTLTDRVLGGLPEHVREAELGRTPTGRLSTPEQVADAVLFLGSGRNGNITGQTVTVAGGR